MRITKNRLVKLLCILTALLALALLAACQGAAPTAAPTEPVPQASATPIPPQPTDTAAAAASSTPAPSQTPSPTAEPAEPAEPTAEPTADLTETVAVTETPTSEPTETPGATATAEPTTTPTAAEDQAGQSCTDVAAFYGDLTVPDDTTFYQGDTFEKGWQLRNNGTCTWGSGYAVVLHSGDPLGAALNNALPASVAPGQTVDVYLSMRAPDSGGTFYSNWVLQNDRGELFGTGSAAADQFWARIQVAWLASGGPVAGSPTEPPGSGGTTGTAGSCEFTTNPGYVQTVIQLINQARAQNGLPALAENPALSAAAQVHSQDMACNDHFSHTGTDGSSWPDRVAAQGYAARLALENVYAGDPSFGGTPEGAVGWWLDSAVHRANILNPEVTEIGVGYVASPQATYTGRFTAVFARP